eukprot:SAG31_NODE_23781_length_496_cov_0.549118_1_plen_49_part_01
MIVGTLMVTVDAVAQQLEDKNARSLIKPTDTKIQFPMGSMKDWNLTRSL